ncbi:hypothetical protein D9619_010571 [Psilocybe cf. subviscida]|uniref:Uncharacterized protein n=1 Tax=Psilocybe cf. subviscida TaxID=2480587 RepID=A0A8H5ERW1_9AGAR|nr:hypothetical protein D9619_010571 [Psilocybe cf. subviscida]
MICGTADAGRRFFDRFSWGQTIFEGPVVPSRSCCFGHSRRVATKLSTRGAIMASHGSLPGAASVSMLVLHARAPAISVAPYPRPSRLAVRISPLKHEEYPPSVSSTVGNPISCHRTHFPPTRTTAHRHRSRRLAHDRHEVA